MKYAQLDYHPAHVPAGHHQHDSMSVWWSRHWNGARPRQFDLRQEALWPTIADVLERPGRVLEAGCGPAQWVQFFDSLGHTTVGVDFASSALAEAKGFDPALRLLSGDLRRLPFPDACFDYVYCAGAVEHDVAGPEAALRELHRVLKTSGWLMCSVPCLNVERRILLPWFLVRDWLKRRELLRRLAGKADPFEFYQYVYSPRAYRRILHGCGFEVLDLRPYGQGAETRVTAALPTGLRRLPRFFNPHMMMAICRRRPAPEGLA